MLTFKVNLGDVDFEVATAFGDLGENEVPVVDPLGVGVLRVVQLLLGDWFIPLD